MSSNINTCFVNAPLKVEIQDSCCICHKLLYNSNFHDSNTVVVKEHILELLKFLVEEIDTTVLENSQICEECFSQMKEAYIFKITYRDPSKQETKPSIKQEVKDENLVMCCICKNIISENSCGLSFDEVYSDMFRYFATKEDLEGFVNPKICNTCEVSISNFQAIMTLLSVYDTGNVHKIDPDAEFVEEDTKLNADMIEIKEEKVDSEIDNIPTEDMEIKTEEVIVKTDSDNEDSNEAGVWSEYKAEGALANKHSSYAKSHKDVSETEMFQCQQCPFQAKHKYRIKNHMLIHKDVNETEMFQCQQCRFQTKYKCSLKKHMFVHNDVNKIETFSCQQCEFQTKRKASLKRHMLLHKDIVEIEMFRCQQCEFQTKRETSLKKHMLLHKGANEIEMFRCQQCEFQTKHKVSLKNHMLVHKDVDETDIFVCQQCKYQTKQKYNLKRHMIIHKLVNETEMFRCQQCKYQTKHKASLKRHMLLHKGVHKPFGCQY